MTVAPAKVELGHVLRGAARRRTRVLAPLVTNRTARVGVALLALVLAAAIAGPLVAPGNGSILAMLRARDTGRRIRSARRFRGSTCSRRY